MKFICFTCQKEFERKPSQVQNHEHPFCSRSCAAITNNKLDPRRQRTIRCIDCGILIIKPHKRCKNCNDERLQTAKNLTLKEAIYKDQQASNKYARVRDHAKRIYQKDNAVCQKCNYSKHVEVCHIQPISSFPLDTKLSIINGKNNILLLCPNCHWEFDHGLLALDKYCG